MANSTQYLPPYTRLATVYGVVTIRRTTSGLWTGRALKKSDFAKKGIPVRLVKYWCAVVQS